MAILHRGCQNVKHLNIFLDTFPLLQSDMVIKYYII